VIESAAGISFESVLNLLPVAVSLLVRQAKKHDVCFFAEVLGFLHYVDDHLFNRALICGDLLLD